MSKRISSLAESPCYKCPYEYDCDKKIERIEQFKAIKDMVFDKKGFNRKECPLYIALDRRNLK